MVPQPDFSTWGEKRWLRTKNNNSTEKNMIYFIFSTKKGLFWALACIWLIYDGPNLKIKIPHIKGETYVGNSTYQPIYTNYIPTEFLINGIVSALLTVVNVICIFITAIIILKIKEVAAPYTASPDLRRYV